MKFFTILIAICLLPSLAPGQVLGTPKPKLDISFNRYYTHKEIGELLQKFKKTWPEFVEVESIGKSFQGREMWLLTLQNKQTGGEFDKAAMYIDANIHGNEIQGAEVCLYTIWYLLENYGKIERVTKLVDQRVFYIAPTVNPDGRDYWLAKANTSSSSRSGQRPIDSDRDGLFDEDPPNDLDNDGNITRMRKKVEKNGTHKIDPDDPRFLVRVKPGKTGPYILLGSEGIDDDGDGRLNEDGPGGYDMNRNNPADWQPNYVQRGAGPYPFSEPEVRSIGTFFYAHPNIASVQSYHNAGGMILRGPGADYVPDYPRADLRVYDAIGKDGAKILPFYRYMILYKDLYTVHGGFVNFAAETLGIISFTNELWSESQRFQSADRDRSDRVKFNDLVMMGSLYHDWKPFKHPVYGDIEIGGWTKESSRVNPRFMLEETCHRNAVFTLNQAEHMPTIEMTAEVIPGPTPATTTVRVVLENKELIPSRTALAAQKKIGLPDFLAIRSMSQADVVAASELSGPSHNEKRRAIIKDMSRLRLESGVGSKAKRTFEWILTGRGPFVISYKSEKGGKKDITLRY
ncbi:MAG: hypothetical protein ACI97A_001486 [Planctomycetota bacterium]|jgi:hypothetical protein